MNITSEQLEAFEKGASAVYTAKGVPVEQANVLLSRHLSSIDAELTKFAVDEPSTVARVPPMGRHVQPVKVPPPGVPTGKPPVDIHNPPIKV